MKLNDITGFFSRIYGEPPFSIVLIDIKLAATQKKIQCVEKPLTEENLRFVALSYRWGELQETTIDTGVGYMSSITSFDLGDFYKLCGMMMKEPDLQHMQYVWIDAISVDQTNPIQRKKTIYQMTSIYEHATYILAVPDLHLQHLKDASKKYLEIIDDIQQLSDFIYHLIHGHTDQLVHIDNQFIDKIAAPKRPALKQLVVQYSNDFTSGLTKKILPLLFMAYRLGTHSFNNSITDVKSPTPFKYDCSLEEEDSEWEQRIIERSIAIRQSMDFLADLIKDWSSRVWVISEYNIAKKKNNLKYWFVQLDCTDMNTLDFFKFDFERPAHLLSQDPTLTAISVRQQFHESMIKQLTRQTFLEMILKSKASKLEDRFYSILPTSQYKHNLIEVAQWEIHTMVAVKLKLYEIMTPTDKLNLLFLSIKPRSCHSVSMFPTFATSNIVWDRCFLKDDDTVYGNFDTELTLCHDEDLHYLKLKPKKYFTMVGSTTTGMALEYDGLLSKLFPVKDDRRKIDLVFITMGFEYAIGVHDANSMALLGCFIENKWIMISDYPLSLRRDIVEHHAYHPFHIY
ncbi:unnamed protein product [Absidia cylindrospora]